MTYTREWQRSETFTRSDGSEGNQCCVVGCPFAGPFPKGRTGQFHPANDFEHWLCYPHWLEYIGHPEAASFGLTAAPAPAKTTQRSLWWFGEEVVA